MILYEFMSRKFSQEEFIQKASKKHDNFYSYNNCKYIDSATKLEIKCPIHGYFIQTPRDHLSGKGCKKCGFISCSNEQKMTFDNFITKANEIHNQKYDYTDVIFKSSKDKIRILCKQHGIFEQRLSLHLFGSGCPKCGYEKRSNSHKHNTEIFTINSKKVHNNKYIYDNVEYISNDKPVEIICRKHGSFFQTPHTHLNNHGCGKCAASISNKESRWLDSLKIYDLKRNTIIRDKINNKRFNVDGYSKINNTIYEFYGDYWHGNPQKYNAEDYCKATKKTFGEMYDQTIKREIQLKALGYKFVTIWEKDFDKCQKRKKQQ